MTRILCCSLTAAGASVARRLPFEHRHGRVVDTVRAEWENVDGLVIVAATGVAVRAAAPLLSDKRGDPAVVCVDDAATFAVALTGGHAGGANRLAREVAALLGATAVVTTASDCAPVVALDSIPGWRAEGDLAGVTRAWLDGSPPAISVDAPLGDWPLPAALADAARAGPDLADATRAGPDLADATRAGPAAHGGAGPAEAGTVIITDSSRAAGSGEVLLRPASLVLGVGASSGASPGRLRDLAMGALAGAELSPASVGAIATIDSKAGEPAIIGLARSLAAAVEPFPAPALAAAAAERRVPNPSIAVEAAVGTASVAEAAALLAAGPGSRLVAPKVKSPDSTVAIVRRARPAGHLHVVGLGPGDPATRTPQASAAVRGAEVVIGYGPYVDLASDLLGNGQLVVRSPIGAETERCREALSRAASGATVALVCSGDAGVYAMASLVLELAALEGSPPVTVVPGVTAALAGAAVLGAPLGHDHAAVSLSDLLTPWEVIERRLVAVAEGDFVVSLYNPRSRRRASQLDRALAILGRHRPPGTPAAVLTDIGRPGQRVLRSSLAALDAEEVGMLSLVVVGSTRTRWVGDRMVTPRGYLEGQA